MKNKTTGRLVLAGLSIAIGLILPFITGQIPEIGNMLLPMHIPVLIAGFILGPKYGLLIGFVLPLLRSLLFSSPIFYPIAITMAFELAAYGFMTGFLYSKFPKNNLSIYASLVISLIFGRLVLGLSSYAIYGMGGKSYTLEMFMAGAFINATLGIVLQILIIPPILMALNHAQNKEF